MLTLERWLDGFWITVGSHCLNTCVTPKAPITTISIQITDIVLLSCGILAAGAALERLRVLSLRQLSEEDAFDDNLLLVGLLGMLFYDMFLLVPAVEAKGSMALDGRMFASKAVLEMIQALLQVNKSQIRCQWEQLI